MFRTWTFQPRKFRPRMFQTGLFSGVDVSDRFFYKKYFFFMFWFLFSQKNKINGKNI